MVDLARSPSVGHAQGRIEELLKRNEQVHRPRTRIDDAGRDVIDSDRTGRQSASTLTVADRILSAFARTRKSTWPADFQAAL
jgi:hypothetical protein